MKAKKTRCFIIAEAGVNHNGSIETARSLIDVAAEAAADAVKFQTFRADKIATKNADKAAYQKTTTRIDESQFDMLKKLELNLEDHETLIEHCRKRNILFLSTPFDLESVDLLVSLGQQIFKIPSGEITNYPLLKKIGALRKQVIISSGMAQMEEIENALKVLIEEGTSRNAITVLHCTTEYPAPFDEVNLLAMGTMKKRLKVEIGYSDHTEGIEVSTAAVALGATIIEKHFTLDKNMPGPDHKASLEPHDLKNLVRALRNVENSLGDGVKRPTPSELKNRDIARKSVVAAIDIVSGEVFTEKNLTVKRPGTGIDPMTWMTIIGKKAKRNFSRDELIEL